MFKCHGGCGCCGCCETCGSSCGCESGSSSCGCNGGGETKEKSDSDKAPKAPAEAGASVKPIPPRPMSDPNASVGQQRNVVRTSFLR
jgi:hypothetical protein